MRQLSSAGLNQEGFEISCVCTPQLFLWKTQTSEDPCSIGEMLFPFFNSKNLLINIPVSFPFPAPVQPMIRIEMLCGNPNHDSHHTDVNDESNHEIDHNRPEGGKIDEPHKSNFPPSLS